MKLQQKNLEFRLYERAPMFICSLSYIIGIVLASSFFNFPTYYINATSSISTLVVLIVLIMVFIVAVILYGYGKSISILICLFMLLAGFTYTQIKLEHTYPQNRIRPHDSITGRVASQSRLSDKSMTIILDDVSVYSSEESEQIKGMVGLTIYGQDGSYLDSEFYLPNSIISAKTNLEYPAVELGTGYYNNRMQSLADGVAYHAITHYGTVSIGKENEIPFILGLVDTIRENLYKNINTYIGDEEGGLLKALLTGEKNDLPFDIKKAFASLGISHLLATSGLHIGVLLLALSYFFRKFKIPIIPSTIVSAIIIFLFMMLTGFRTSIIRASIMWVVLIGARLVGSKYNGINSLGVAMFVMILLNPFCIYDTSFVLSCMSVMAILLYYNPVSNVFKKYKDKKVYQAVCVTIAVMIFTWPVMAYYFNSVSLLSPIFNIVFIPVMSLLLIIMIIFTVFSGVAFIAPVIATIAKVIAFVVIYVARVLEPFALKLSIISPAIWVIGLWTVGMALLIKQIVSTKLKIIKIVAVSLMAIAFMVVVYTRCNMGKEDKITVYSDGSSSILYLQDSDCRALIMNDDSYIARTVLQKNLTIKLDTLIFTGNNPSDLHKIMDNLSDYHLDKIYASDSIVDEMYTRNIVPFKDLTIGDTNVSIKQFKAKSKTAKIHFATVLDHNGVISLYFDPMSLREGAFNDIKVDNVISSKWSKSRMENIQNISFNNLIINDSKYLYQHFASSLEQKGSKIYNINDAGMVNLLKESEIE